MCETAGEQLLDRVWPPTPANTKLYPRWQLLEWSLAEWMFSLKKKKGHYSLFSDFFYSDWHKQKKINVSGMNLGLLSVLTVNHF